MPASGGDESNGRVTMAVLGQQLSEVLRRIDRFEGKFDRYTEGTDKKLAYLDVRLENTQGRVDRHREELDDLRESQKYIERRSNVVDILVGVGAAIGSVIAGILGTRQ